MDDNRQLGDADPMNLIVGISGSSGAVYGQRLVNSCTDNLLIRAADVTFKERRPLVLMPTESPLHLRHCRLLDEAAQMGAIIAAPARWRATTR
jgi:3-polyprenyl-4-hydroxybenzoate decarboxylase